MDNKTENTPINYDALLGTVILPWIGVDEQMPPTNRSCLCLRNNTKICNLYFDGMNWMDDGYDSKGIRKFKDVTHWIALDWIVKP